MLQINDIKFRMLQVRENEIQLRKWSDGAAQLRSSEGTLPLIGPERAGCVNLILKRISYMRTLLTLPPTSALLQKSFAFVFRLFGSISNASE